MNFWGRRGFAVAWVATALLSLPALRAEFSLDDFLQHLILEGRVPELGLGPASLYDFTGGHLARREWFARGYVPWLTDPDFAIRFFRPLGSLSIALDQKLFGRAALPSHVFGVLLFFLVTGVAFAFFRRTLSPNRAGLAAVLFSLASGHYLNLIWTAGRHIVVGGLFGALAVLAHVQHLEQPKGRRAWLAPLLLGLSMLASETFLAAGALIACYELFGRDAAREQRFRRAAPWFAAMALYVALYAAAGYGVKHSGLYVSPLSAPGAFLSAVATRLPSLLGELSFALPWFLWGAAEPLRPLLAALGLLATALVVWLAHRASTTALERRRFVWFTTSTLLGALPMVGGVPDGRILLLPFLASMPLVATALDGAFALPFAPRFLSFASGGVLAFMHLAFAPLLRVGASAVMTSVAQKQRILAETADFASCAPGSTLYVVTGSDPSLCVSGAPALKYFRPDVAERHPAYALLSMAAHAHELERRADGGLALTVVGAPRNATMFETLFRDTPLRAGDVVAFPGFEAHVLEAEGGFFTRVVFKLPANACLVSLEHGKLVGRPQPEPGSRRLVPHEPGPMGL
jgi:hypothetical protein